MSTIRIVAPHFVAGIDSEGNCAPIIQYMRGWDEAQIMLFCARKGWSIEFLDDEEQLEGDPTLRDMTPKFDHGKA